MTNTEQPQVVLLHGVGLDHTMWQPLRKRLERPSMALDLPGHGSQPVLREEQDLGSLATDVLNRIPVQEPVHLVGFSLGAMVAQYIARFAPERVLTLTAVSSVCQRTESEAAAVEMRLSTAGNNFAEGVARALDRWYPADTTTVPAHIIDATRSVLLANDLESYLRAYAVFAHGDRQIANELASIMQPTLVITGQLDPGSTPEMSYRLGAAVPNSRVHIVPGARHMLPVENPAALAAELKSFFFEIEGKQA